MPYRVLDHWDVLANKELLDTIKRGEALIEAEIRNSEPDPDDNVLIGILKKSTSPDPAQDEWRLDHGAPFELTSDLRDRVRDALAGVPRDDVEIPEGQSAEETRDPTQVAYQGMNLDDWNAGGTPVILRDPESGQEKCAKNQANLLEAILMRRKDLPVIVIVSQMGEGQKSTEAYEWEAIAIRALGEDRYSVPVEMEPLADLARRFPRKEFLAIVKGEGSEEKILAQDRAKRAEEAFYSYWREGIEAGRTEEEILESDQQIALDQIATKSLILAQLVTERHEAQGQRAREARQEVANYMTERGIPLRRMDLGSLYTQANKGKGQYPVTTTKEIIPSSEVEVRDTTGKWHKATEKGITPTGLHRVLREDGQTRYVQDQDVRLPGEGNIGLDKSENIMYNGGMETISIPEYNVTIPVGSNSWKMEKALEPFTAEMTSLPLKVNKATWEKNLADQCEKLALLTEICHKAAGKKFKVNSSRDCGNILFKDMGLPVQRVNKQSGEASVDKETLQALHAEGTQLAGQIMEAREAQSKLSQLEAWAQFAEAGEVKATWNQYGTPHGRYSCQDPNLQNRIREIRETIEAPEGYKFVSFDLGQAEYVTWASLSKDKLLSQTFLNRDDLHRRMYDEIRVAAPDVDLHEEDPRQAGKTINFALLYLMQPFVLAKKLGITAEEASKLIAVYAERAPEAVAYRDAVLDDFKKTGIVRTKFGRERRLTVPKGRAGLHEVLKTAWHHHNAGTAAEILKLKQVQLGRAMQKKSWGPNDARIALNMHDELILEVRDDLVEEAKTLGLEQFGREIQGFLPFKIDCRVGQTWLSISK